MSAADVMNRLLSRELAAAVGVEGIGAVPLDIRCILRSIEDVIGRIVDEQGLDTLCLVGQDGDRIALQRPLQVGMVLPRRIQAQRLALFEIFDP